MFSSFYSLTRCNHLLLSGFIAFLVIIFFLHWFFMYFFTNFMILFFTFFFFVLFTNITILTNNLILLLFLKNPLQLSVFIALIVGIDLKYILILMYLISKIICCFKPNLYWMHYCFLILSKIYKIVRIDKSVNTP